MLILQEIYGGGVKFSPPERSAIAVIPDLWIFFIFFLFYDSHDSRGLLNY